MAISEAQWRTAFDADPDRSLDRLLRGYELPDGFGPYAPQDIAGFLFVAESPGRVAALDAALCRWLTARLTEDPLTMRRPALFAADLSQGLGVAQRLPLPHCHALLAQRCTEFDALTWMLSVDGRDPRFDFWLALAATQPTRRFLGRWLTLCDEVGQGVRPERWLTVAFLGLRRLPRPDGCADLDAAVLTGLARWGRHLGKQDQDRFLSRWRDLRASYPATPADWRERVAPVVGAHAGKLFVRWWADDVGLAVVGAGKGKVREPERGDDFRDRVAGLSKSTLAVEVQAFREAHLRAVDDGGDRRYLGLSFDVAGRRLLFKEMRLLALSLAMPAVQYEPGDPMLWDLLAESLAACGQMEQAEAVLWHARARFGDDVHVRTQLGMHLGRAGRAAEAEALYRETLRLCPGDVVATGALAHLLAENHREVEAETLCRGAISADPGYTNVIYRTDLARLLVMLGRWGEAKTLFLDIMEHFPRDVHCRHSYGLELVWRGEEEAAKAVRAELRALRDSEAETISYHMQLKAEGKPRPLVRPKGLPPTLPLPDDYVPMDDSWQALRAGFLLSPAVSEDLLLCTTEERAGLRREAQETLHRMRVTHRNHPLVRLIAAGRGLDEPAPLAEGTQLSFPLKLQMARRRGLGASELVAEAGSLRPLLWLARFEAGIDHDGQALREMARWLAAKPPAAYSPLAYLHQRLRRLSGMDAAIKHITLPSDTFKTIFGKVLAQMEDLAPDLLDIALMRMVEEELHAGMDVAIAA